MSTMAESGAPQAGINDIVGGMRGMMMDDSQAAGADMQPTPAEILERLEDFFSTPDFTSAVRAFVDEHESAFVYVEEGEEQPLGNYDLYLKYTKLIEELLENFLSGHGIDQQDVAQLCQEERDSGNQTSYCLDFLIASTEYDAFVQMMYDFRGMKEWQVTADDFEGLECLGFGALEEEAGKGSAGDEQPAA